jgi:hypothetical protein
MALLKRGRFLIGTLIAYIFRTGTEILHDKRRPLPDVLPSWQPEDGRLMWRRS